MLIKKSNYISTHISKYYYSRVSAFYFMLSIFTLALTERACNEPKSDKIADGVSHITG